jgi:dihydrofolate reductase
LIVSLLVAMDVGRGIGKSGQVPWHLSGDLKLFKILTMGHHIVMGRKTYESIGKPLIGRNTLLLSRDHSYIVQDGLCVHSLDEAIEIAQSHGEKELFIIGGGEVFSQAISFANRIYLTSVQALVQCEVFFPEFDAHEWLVLEAGYHPADQRNEHAFVFQRLEKSP